MTDSNHPTIDLHKLPGIAENLPCCFYVVEAEPPYHILYANSKLLTLFDCRNFNELWQHTDGIAWNVIAMDDRERIKQEVLHEIATKDGSFAHARGHLFTRTSRIRYADVSGNLVETADYGKVYYCTLQEVDIPQSGTTVDRDVRDYVISHLNEALENHWIQVYYQPVIRTLTGEVCGMEALARWIDPQIGFLSPASFIPVLEQTRLIHHLDAYVLDEACRMLRQRLNHDLPITPVSFNLSRYDFEQMDVFSFVEQTRKKYEVPRDFLHVEITESVLSQDAQVIHQALDQLRNEGYEVWLDDFGSDYSSLNILKDYTVDLIKLDMAFLSDFSKKSRCIIASTILMAKTLGIKTLAEGVETKEHADFLTEIGCGRQQGYFYGKPRPLAGTLAHVEAEGRHIEPRKWFHYNDMASMAIRQTERACAIFDMQENDQLRFLYANQAYREQIKEMGYRIQDIQESLNAPVQTDISRMFWNCVHHSQQSHQTESFWYVDGGSYISIDIHAICEANRHLLVKLEFQNVSQNSVLSQQNHFDEHLRYLYSMFDNVCLVDFEKDTIAPLYFQNQASAEKMLQQVHNIRQSLQNYAEQYVYEEDRAKYLAFCNPDTVIERIQKSPHGRITCRFRIRDRHGNYNWDECTAILLVNRKSPLMLTTNKIIDTPDVLPEARQKGEVPLFALLWESFQHNTRFHYFWKDRERRFLGATRAFLKYYGLSSVDAIIGKTDEDMNWHIDNDTYRLDELAVLQKGKVIQNAAGECIIRGTLHHITCYKWPIYREGEIIGLMGVFFDADALYQDIHKTLPSPFKDPITGLHNRQGFLGDLSHYQETYTIEKKPYVLILLESRFDEQLQASYGREVLRALVQKEAAILRQVAGIDASISRIQNAVFAILRRENNHQESEVLANRLQQELQAIHAVDSNPVTITFAFSLVHSDESAVQNHVDKSISYIYRLAMERLRHHAE